MNQIIDSIYARKSVRKFEPLPVGEDIRRLLIESAVQAPTAGNQVLYTIIDVTDRELKERLAKSCDNQPFIAAAPVVYIFVADHSRWHRSFEIAGAEPRDLGAGDLMLAVTDACIAAQNMVSAAESLGLGSCYIGDILERCEEHRSLLGLPDTCMPACMLVLGYPAPDQKTRQKPVRIDPKYFVCENRYHSLTDEELQDCYEDQQKRSGKPFIRPFADYMKAFCTRKFNSDFSLEMSRSVREYLKAFSGSKHD